VRRVWSHSACGETSFGFLELNKAAHFRVTPNFPFPKRTLGHGTALSFGGSLPSNEATHRPSSSQSSACLFASEKAFAQCISDLGLFARSQSLRSF